MSDPVSECRCVRCGDCGGSGQTRVKALEYEYPEWDLETCSTCGGTGIVEKCVPCQLREELAEALDGL